MKTLIICRHAKADYPEGVVDFERPLKERGLKDAEKMGILLASHDFMPDLVVSSPATRALQTAHIVAGQLGYAGEIRLESSIYEEGAGNLLQLIQRLPDNCRQVMLFGHNPTLSDAVRVLLNMLNPYDMPTSAMVCIENPFGSWDFSLPNSGRLRWVLVPRMQRKGSDES